MDWYNNKHYHSGIKFVSPAQRHEGIDQAILENRAKVYEIAFIKRPERWSGPRRNWSRPKTVTLNPEKMINLPEANYLLEAS